MTQEQFNSTDFVMGMRIKYIPTGEFYDIESVDFDECIIGVDALDFEICESCEKSYPVTRWFRCENCEIIKDDNLIVKITSPSKTNK